MSNKIKNIIIINDFDYIQGGASKIAIDTANMLAKNTNLKIYFFSGCNNNEKSNLDNRVIRFTTNQKESLKDKNKLRGIKNNIYNTKSKKQLKNLLESLNPEETIIHMHGWTKVLSSSVFKTIFKQKFKMVITLHDYFVACPNGGFYDYKKNKICHLDPMTAKCLLCNCDSRNYIFKIVRIIRCFVQNKIIKVNKNIKYAISISKLSENVLNKYLPNAKITRIYNPVNYPINNDNKDLDKKNKYLYVGRVDKEKGVDDFCRCVTELGLEGIVIGIGTEKEKLEKEYNNIKFLGWKSQKEIIRYLDASKALIFPSKWYETAGLTIIEALNRGVYCYVRSSCAGKEFITENKNGNTFDNLIDLKQKILMNKKRTQIEEYNPKFFSIEYYYNSLEKLYNQIIEGE